MADLVGKVLMGRYRVDQFLGKGGMAEVYKVWDRQRAVYLAMKILHSDFAEDRVFLRRFEREAETLSALEHPYIVRFYGLEQDKGLSFILMDFVEGITLRKKIFDKSQPFSPEQILNVMRPVCSALYYAHERGRVHCDIKPANIMLKSNGDVLVADFGIARLMEAGTTMTMAGAGTPAYMAPEQVLGKKPSPQTDIYSLGIVLYEMLTGGERPFTGEQARIEGTTSEKVRWEQMKLPAPSPRLNNPTISSQLEKVVLTCLKKNPEQRYTSTLELLQDLESALEGIKQVPATPPKPIPAQPLEVEPRSPQKEVPRQLSSKARIRGIGTVIGLIALLGIAGILFLRPGLLGPDIPVTTTVSPTSDNKAIDFPLVTQTSTEEALIPAEFPTASSIPTEAATPTSDAPPTELDSQGATMLLVPAGEFKMGRASGDLNFEEDEDPLHTVYLDAYYIDKFEVTNAFYKACVDAGDCKPPKHSYFFSNSPNRIYYGDPQYDQYPVVYVDWEMANTYCEWRDARLPTEAEWEKAARGTEERIYPWGSGLDCQTANYQNCDDRTSDVGFYEKGKSPYGVYDMAGNVWEWVADWYANDYYRNSPPSNPSGPKSEQQARVLRGGSWAEYDIRVSNRNRFAPNYNNFDIGFRCARNASP
jgi:formylglycine-generating enzyme required for sulfatase activity/tRNA A-37 threonylcarbamoyl transferase component Bud32